MREYLEKELVEKYPLLYADYEGDEMNTCMAWGFSCGDGWFSIIDEGSAQLEEMIKEYIEKNPDDDYHPRASQVKEKFGTLRFYMTAEVGDMSKVISNMEERTITTCEICSAPGKLRGKGYMQVTCDFCEARRREK